MSIADLFKRRPKQGPLDVAAGDVNIKLAYSGLPTPLAENMEALLSAHADAATKVTSLDFGEGASLHFFTLRPAANASLEGRRLVPHVFASARPYHSEALSNLVKGASLIVLLHAANESSHIDREWLEQARLRGPPELPVVVQLVRVDARDACDLSRVRDGLGLPADAPIIPTSRALDAAAETFEAAVRLAAGRIART
jgi:hypothetical protein